MRVLMTTTGYTGHALPMVPFAQALLRAGHELQIVGPRSRGEILARMGLPFRSIYDSPEADIRRIGMSTIHLPFEVANARLVADGFANMEARAALPSVLEAIDSWAPDVVIRESYEFAAAVACDLRALPLCCVSLGLDVTEQWILAHASAPLAELREEQGLSPEPWTTYAPYLTLMPTGLEIPTAEIATDRRRFRDTAPRARQPLDPRWTTAGDPVVYVSFGTLTADIGLFPALYRAAAWALADRPLRVLMTIGEKHSPDDLGSLPANVHVERWVPQDSVMPHAALTISHGGYGSMMSSLSHGVPLVVMPLFTDDHHRNAACITASGVGLVIPPLPNFRSLLAAGADALQANLASAVERVLTEPSFKSASERIAEEFTLLPPVEELSSLLSDLRDEHRAASHSTR